MELYNTEKATRRRVILSGYYNHGKHGKHGRNTPLLLISVSSVSSVSSVLSVVCKNSFWTYFGIDTLAIREDLHRRARELFKIPEAPDKLKAFYLFVLK